MPEKFIRTYPDGTRGAYSVQPGSSALLQLASIKPAKTRLARSDKRRYPVYAPGDSTADYVRRYFELNTESRHGSPCAYGQHIDHMTLYAPLPDTPAAVYTGVDSVEVTDDAA